MKQSRRVFIKTTSAVTAGVVIGPNLLAVKCAAENTENPICVFTKCLQFLGYDGLGETLAKVGFKNVELSVRKGGHVLPENVKTDLPKALTALKKYGISTPMMVTDILNSNDPVTEIVIGTASALGIKNYRMGYLSYDPGKSIMENLDGHRKAFETLEILNRKYNIHGCYQNHSGVRVGGPVWDLYSLLKDRDPVFMGVQYDIRHAVVEGGVSWPLGMKLLSPWIKTTAIKDFFWKNENEKWKLTNVPLGEGMVDFDAYLKEYIALGISGPVTIHYEYDLGGAQSGDKNPTMSREKIYEYLTTDLNWLKMRFKEHSIDGLFN
ncbi:MAG: sugar phosphate isomerase/epimerase [Bacteroidales bacterium]|jgi:sugar phosphate isomerase/epimerase|nr:sugar phosphate isomerase/epimerase [Bacteroidales bacterium]